MKGRYVLWIQHTEHRLRVSVHSPHNPPSQACSSLTLPFNCGRTNSVCRVLDCRAGGRRFDSRGRTHTQVLKKLRNEGTAFALQSAGPLGGLVDHVEMAVLSPVGDVKIVSPISTFVLNTVTIKEFFI